jgi:transcriptional regulator of met regulon
MLGLFSGGEITLDLAMERPAALYMPGDTISVTATIDTAKGANVRKVYAGLVRVSRYQITEQRTDADGDAYDAKTWRTDEQWITREVLAEGRIVAGGQRHRLAWTIPHDAAPSFAGEIIQTRWLVKVVADRKLARDASKEIELRVGAAGTAQVAAQRHATNSDLAIVAFDLPSHAIEGQTLRGQVQIQPSQRFDVRGVRIELVRQETVTAGDKPHVRETAVQRVDLAGKSTLQPGMPLTHDVALTIPAAGCPTHQTATGSSQWLVKATLDRPLKSDVCASQTMVVATSAPSA